MSAMKPIVFARKYNTVLKNRNAAEKMKTRTAAAKQRSQVRMHSVRFDDVFDSLERSITTSCAAEASAAPLRFVGELMCHCAERWLAGGVDIPATSCQPATVITCIFSNGLTGFGEKVRITSPCVACIATKYPTCAPQTSEYGSSSHPHGLFGAGCICGGGVWLTGISPTSQTRLPARSVPAISSHTGCAGFSKTIFLLSKSYRWNR